MREVPLFEKQDPHQEYAGAPPGRIFVAPFEKGEIAPAADALS
ncbi:hypothetical protein [Bradyrhizobium sp. 21]|nr:hypothetical protein [Bradyrhizobium sp. 21]